MTETFELAREQEENLIGALLKDPSQLDSVATMLAPSDFYMQVLGWAFGAMLSLRERGLGVDSVTLGDELERHGKMDEFGIAGKPGRLALLDLRTNFKGDLPQSYAVKVLGYAAKRNMIQEFSTGTTWAYNGREASEIRDDMIRRLTNIKVPNNKSAKHTQTFKEALSQNYDEVNNGNISFVPTGFIDIDRAMNDGLYAPDFMLVAARPGCGKTALLLSVAMNAAKKNKNIVMFSLEMSNSQIIMRACSMETGIPFGAMRSRKMSDAQKALYNDFVENFERTSIHLNDLPAISINTMRQTLREIEANYGKADLVIVDYLQLQGVDKDEKFGTREEEVSSVSRGLKAIAKEFDVPVLAAAQLSRAIEKRAEKKPILSDLRESGSLEQDADIVAFIHPDEHKTGNTDFIIAKHRNGPVGSFPLTFRKERTKFENGAKY
jgi:replicative DNA helicase